MRTLNIFLTCILARLSRGFVIPQHRAVAFTVPKNSPPSTTGTALGCTRFLYETGEGTYLAARSMDWNDLTAQMSVWTFPRGMKRDGGVGPKSIEWTSKYGSVIVSMYDCTTDGLNEAGLAGNGLYLAEAEYGDPESNSKARISVGAWLQYFLDTFDTVEAAVEYLRDDPLQIVAPVLPNGRPATIHYSLSDKVGDSAIIEYIDGKVQIHHSKSYQVMTNSPVYEDQLAIERYWNLVGGNNALPGTINAADRFVRASYFLAKSPKYKDRDISVASVFSQIRAVSVPLGVEDPEHPNISSTLWRTVADHDAGRYFFESAGHPCIFWIDLDKADLNPGASPKKVEIMRENPITGEASSKLVDSEPFEWMKPRQNLFSFA